MTGTNNETTNNHHKNSWSALLSVSDKSPKLRGEIHELFDIIEKSADADELYITQSTIKEIKIQIITRR